MCHKGYVKKVKNIKKIKNKNNGWKGAQVRYKNKEGEEKGAGFVNFEKNFEQTCDECGRKNYKCRLNKSEAEKVQETSQQTQKKQIEKEDITQDFK